MTDAATPGTATASTDMTLAGAARAIERLEERRRRAEEDDSSRQAGESDRTDAQRGASHSDDAGNAGEDEPGVLVMEDAGQAEEDTADGAAATADEPRYRVKVDGAEAEVPLRELIQGYQRGADYTRKTMRLADERRAVEELHADAEAEYAAAVEERQAVAEQAAGAIPTLRAQLATFGGMDWQRLAAEQPALHAQAQALFDSLSAQLQSAESAQFEAAASAEIQQRQTAEAQRSFAAAEKQAVMANVPEMADPERAPREAAALHRYLSAAGYEAPEIARLVDHRDFILARKAMLYDRLMASSGKGREKIAVASRVLPPGAVPERRTGAREKRAKLMTRLSRSGSTDDAAKVIESMI